MTDLLKSAQNMAEELFDLRHSIHRRPELGNREFETAARIEDYLTACGIETHRLLDTAVVGTLRGTLPGPAVALRADMDALPIQEATGSEFSSQNSGVMHACGHDVHMAALLGAAKLLASRRETLPGTVLFLFQPDEEGNGGAKRMIDAGVLKDVDAVFGAHVTPELPAGHVGVRYGKFYAASDMFEVAVTGKSAHGAEREKGVDALAAAAAAVTAVLELPKCFPDEKSVVTVGTFHSGAAGNILADRAEFTGILRTLGQDTRAKMRMLFQQTVRKAAGAFGAKADIHLRESYPGVVNHTAETSLVEDAASEILGSDKVHAISVPTMTTEDFGYFLLERPGSYYHIGAGCDLPLHNPGFLPDDSAVVTAAAVHAAVAIGYLQRHI